MTRVINFPTNLKKKLEDIKKNGGMWEIAKGKYAIKHFEIERLAKKNKKIGQKNVFSLLGCAL